MEKQKIIATSEWTDQWAFEEKVFINKYDEQMVQYTLIKDGEPIATETRRLNLGEPQSPLEQIKRLIRDLSSDGSNRDKCLKCRYKIGDYSGDITYLFYMLFVRKLRAKLRKFKGRLIKLAKKLGLEKSKTTKSK